MWKGTKNKEHDLSHIFQNMENTSQRVAKVRWQTD